MKRDKSHRRYYPPMQNADGTMRKLADGEVYSVQPNGWRGTPRNSPCPCGSGKRYKRCCMEKMKQQNPSVDARQANQQTKEAR